MMNERLGDKLQKLRIKKGLTQDEVSRDLSINANTLASYERNIREPRVGLLAIFAEYYGVTADYLIGMSEYETNVNAATGERFPLTNEALAFLRSCSAEQLDAISRLLSVPSSSGFLSAFSGYVEECNITDKDGHISEKYLPLLDHVNRAMSEAEFINFVERFSWDSLEKSLLELVHDVRQEIDNERKKRKRGRPYNTKKKSQNDLGGNIES